jgi:hypothetical protein
MAVSMSWPMLGSLARSWMYCQRASEGTQKTLWLEYSSRSSMNCARRFSLGDLVLRIGVGQCGILLEKTDWRGSGFILGLVKLVLLADPRTLRLASHMAARWPRSACANAAQPVSRLLLSVMTVLEGAVRANAAIAVRGSPGHLNISGPSRAVDVTLRAHCRPRGGLTVGRIGPRRRRDANANGRDRYCTAENTGAERNALC